MSWDFIIYDKNKEQQCFSVIFYFSTTICHKLYYLEKLIFLTKESWVYIYYQAEQNFQALLTQFYLSKVRSTVYHPFYHCKTSLVIRHVSHNLPSNCAAISLKGTAYRKIVQIYMYTSLERNMFIFLLNGY